MRRMNAFAIFAAVLGVSCGQKMNSSLRSPASMQTTQDQKITSFSLSCDEFIASGFKPLYTQLQSKKTWPSESEFVNSFESSGSRFLLDLNENQKAEVRIQMKELYRRLSMAGENYSQMTSEEKEAVHVALSSAELRVDNDEDKFFELDLKSSVEDFESVARAAGVMCWSRSAVDANLEGEDLVEQQNPNREIPGLGFVQEFSTSNSLFQKLKSTNHPAVYGARKVMSVAYQSCEASTIRPLTASDADLRGLRYIGQHPMVKSVSLFDVGSVSAVVNSHFYIKNLRKPQSSCFNTTSAPLIYDFGGKPNPYSGNLNIFADAGTGSRSLGIDCSGFVFSSLASAGMKLWASRETRPTDVMAVGARSFMSPRSSGLSCLDRIYVTNHKWPLVPGDIMATPGHVLMIDSVKKDAKKEYDPFGINSFQNVSQCTSANISTSKFDFILIQSSATKMVGINRIHIRDYLRMGGASTSEALRRYALSACYARFGKKLSFDYDAYGVGIVRHRRTPACMGSEVALARESCLNSCRN